MLAFSLSIPHIRLIGLINQHKKSSLSGISPERLLFQKKAATYSPTLRCSTIGAPGLNFSVRDGKRWNPRAIAT